MHGGLDLLDDSSGDDLRRLGSSLLSADDGVPNRSLDLLQGDYLMQMSVGYLLPGDCEKAEHFVCTLQAMRHSG
jgi:hypothetical protein